MPNAVPRQSRIDLGVVNRGSEFGAVGSVGLCGSQLCDSELESVVELSVGIPRRVVEALRGGGIEHHHRPTDSNEGVGAFFGAYPTGFACRSDHVDQIAAGPTVRCFELSEARLLGIPAGGSVAKGHRLQSGTAFFRVAARRAHSAPVCALA